MSHFSVAVFTEEGGKSVEELLMPYHEFESTDINEYLQEIDITEQERNNYKNESIEFLRSADGTLKSKYDDIFYRDPTSDEQQAYDDGILDNQYCKKDWQDGKGRRLKIYYIPEGWEKVTIACKDVKSFFEYIYDEYGYETVLDGEAPDYEKKHRYGYIVIDNDGNVLRIISRTNPNKKWDWWQEGGRYSCLKGISQNAYDKSGEYIPHKMKDLNFEPDSDEYNKALRFWEIVVEGATPISEAEKNYTAFHYKPEWYRTIYKDKASYARQCSTFSTFAVITPDGKWYEKGEMHWFGSFAANDETSIWNDIYKKRFIDTADPEWTLTIIDCHI